MSAGKEKCEALRRIRKDVAERYGLQYTPSKCTQQGDCSGTCPKCDAELENLQRQLASRGITDIDLTNIDFTNIPIDIKHPEDILAAITIGLPAYPYVYEEK